MFGKFERLLSYLICGRDYCVSSPSQGPVEEHDAPLRERPVKERDAPPRQRPVEEHIAHKRSRAASSSKVLRLASELNLKKKKYVYKVHAANEQASADGKRFYNDRKSGTSETKASGRRHRTRQKPSESLAPSLSPSDAKEVPIEEDESYLHTPPNPCAATAESIDAQINSLSAYALDPTRAYKWFLTVRAMVLEKGCADYALDNACSEIELVFMVMRGWLPLGDCLTWTDGRHTLGEGLVQLAAMEPTVLMMEDGVTRPSKQAVREFQQKWVVSRDTSLRYDWRRDEEERKQHGPFGPAVASYAVPAALEKILTLLSYPDSYTTTGCLPTTLQALFLPILARNRMPQENRKRKCDEAHTQRSNLRSSSEGESMRTGMKRKRLPVCEVEGDDMDEGKSDFSRRKRVKHSSDWLCPSRRRRQHTGRRPQAYGDLPPFDPFLSFSFDPTRTNACYRKSESAPPPDSHPMEDRSDMDICTDIPVR
ncbi:hypothetical protein DFH11DRAFT_1546472 [Phellopilus nigrolimitatus]|nr:hypothetical protein DFH11DRAFT_1546472 [Phellopilus nigrolimitatus]